MFIFFGYLIFSWKLERDSIIKPDCVTSINLEKKADSFGFLFFNLMVYYMVRYLLELLPIYSILCLRFYPVCILYVICIYHGHHRIEGCRKRFQPHYTFWGTHIWKPVRGRFVVTNMKVPRWLSFKWKNSWPQETQTHAQHVWPVVNDARYWTWVYLPKDFHIFG